MRADELRQRGHSFDTPSLFCENLTLKSAKLRKNYTFICLCHKFFVVLRRFFARMRTRELYIIVG